MKKEPKKVDVKLRINPQNAQRLGLEPFRPVIKEFISIMLLEPFIVNLGNFFILLNFIT
jgi:hypothetical protein